ncbi:MAG: extracellular solute-binding protein [Cyclobacteriaceae bacterium]
MKKYIAILTAAVALLASCNSSSDKKEDKTTAKEDQVVNVYSQRHYDADKKVFAKFEEKTGIKVNVIKAGADELINKIALEGESTNADVFMTVDAAKLYRAKEKDLLQAVTLPESGSIAAALKDSDNFWHPVTYRARVIAYAKDKVTPSELSTYEDLSNDKWDDKILIRSSASGYNQSLLASIIEAKGEEAARSWAEGVKENMVREPQGGDRDQIKAMASGVGKVAVVNTYYVGLLLNSTNPEERKAGEYVALYFPNQEGRGTHVNVSGAGVTKYAKNKENAVKFLEFLQSKEAQTILVNNSYEFPVNPAVELPATLKSWGDFKIDELTFSKNTENHDKAVKIFDEVGWK